MPYGKVSALKHWKMAKPLPSVQLYARLMGNIQYQCPICGNLNPISREIWRRARTRCRRMKCRARFRVGIGFSEHKDAYTAFYLGPYNGYLSNVLGNFIGDAIIGRAYGKLEYECPECHTSRTAELDWDCPQVTCCKTWNVQLLLYKSTGRSLVQCPIDWITKHETPTVQPLPDSQADSLQ